MFKISYSRFTTTGARCTFVVGWLYVVIYCSTTRQEGKLLNFIVKYRYAPDATPNPNASDSGYIQYKDLRSVVLYYAEPTPELPMTIYWEAVNLAVSGTLEKVV